MSSPLENLAGPGKSLRAEPPDDTEIQGLIRTGKARLLGEYEGLLDVDDRLVNALIDAKHAVAQAL